jgi:hypothetical protein
MVLYKQQRWEAPSACVVAPHVISNSPHISNFELIFLLIRRVSASDPAQYDNSNYIRGGACYGISN